MHIKHFPPIVADDNKEEDDRLIFDEKSESEVKSAEEIPKEIYQNEIYHPSHPNHPLYLQDDLSITLCSLCGYLLKELGYECHKGECDFKLHQECASVMPTIKHEQHNHLLFLIESSNEKRACQNCHSDLNFFHARCFQCDIDYHVQCGPQGLPDTTIYEFHNHSLYLSYNIDRGKLCDICKNEINPNYDGNPNYGEEPPMYSCKKCDYCCHVRCVISEIKFDKREKLDHSIHEHVLFSCDEDDKDGASCFVCGNFVCAADETTCIYCCSPCSFYIHKSCIPALKITHEFHPHHPLTLYWKKEGICCDACHRDISGFTYSCVECDFDIGLECACTSKVPTIRDRRHDHLLTFFNKMYKNENCIMECGLCTPDAAFLRCVKCDFNVHLFCSPLPQVIDFKDHLHSPLALKDYHIEDDFGEYYCDHCEGPRDPKECAYRCCVEGCPYVAEFNCVLDEVVRSLNEKHEEVGFFRTVNRLAANEYYYKVVTKGLCLHDVYKSSPKEELELEDLTRSTEMIWESNIIRDNLHFSYLIFNSDAIEHVREKWSHFPLSTMDLKSEVVTIGNYIITKDLETVFSQIHRKYSDIGDLCTLSEGLKTIVLIQFVQLIQEMIETKILKITDEVYLSWLVRVLFASNAQFKVDFVLEHMEKIQRTRFGLKASFDQFYEVKDYYKEMEVITDEIEVQKAKLVKLKKKEEESIELLLSRGLKEERYRLLDELDFTLETAGKALL